MSRVPEGGKGELPALQLVMLTLGSRVRQQRLAPANLAEPAPAGTGWREQRGGPRLLPIHSCVRRCPGPMPLTQVEPQPRSSDSSPSPPCRSHPTSSIICPQGGGEGKWGPHGTTSGSAGRQLTVSRSVSRPALPRGAAERCGGVRPALQGRWAVCNNESQGGAHHVAGRQHEHAVEKVGSVCMETQQGGLTRMGVVWLGLARDAGGRELEPRRARPLHMPPPAHTVACRHRSQRGRPGQRRCCWCRCSWCCSPAAGGPHIISVTDRN